jgi:hypothetical protein
MVCGVYAAAARGARGYRPRCRLSLDQAARAHQRPAKGSLNRRHERSKPNSGLCRRHCERPRRILRPALNSEHMVSACTIIVGSTLNMMVTGLQVPATTSRLSRSGARSRRQRGSWRPG